MHALIFVLGFAATALAYSPAAHSSWTETYSGVDPTYSGPAWDSSKALKYSVPGFYSTGYVSSYASSSSPTIISSSSPAHNATFTSATPTVVPPASSGGPIVTPPVVTSASGTPLPVATGAANIMAPGFVGAVAGGIFAGLLLGA